MFQQFQRFQQFQGLISTLRYTHELALALSIPKHLEPLERLELLERFETSD